jgi:hypothetical protein
MAALVPMLGAVFAHAVPPDASGKKRSPKPKTSKRAGHRVTRGEKSVVEPHQQHGELATAAAPMPLTDRQRLKERAKSEMHRATESWISGHMTTSEHNAVHARAKHVLAGKHPREFSGRSGERKIKGLR